MNKSCGEGKSLFYMLDSVSEQLQRNSRWRYILIWASISISLALAMNFLLKPAFMAATAGHSIIDMQVPIQVDNLPEQLDQYTAESRLIYFIFLLADTVFPFTANVCIALLWARLLQGIGFTNLHRYRYLLLLPFIGMLLDWAENIFFSITVYSWPEWQVWAVQTGAALRETKLFGLVIKNGLTLLLISWLLITKIRSALRNH